MHAHYKDRKKKLPLISDPQLNDPFPTSCSPRPPPAILAFPFSLDWAKFLPSRGLWTMLFPLPTSFTSLLCP